MKLCITAQKRGQILQMTCSIIKRGNQNGDVESQSYTICDCADIRIKFTHLKNGFVTSSISYRISENTQRDPAIKTYIICSMEMDRCCITKSYLCDDDWSGFIHIGNKRNTSGCGDIDLYVVEAKFSVQLSETPSFKILYNDNGFTDFSLSPESGSGVQVHKAVLATHSEVFKSMLNGEWKETARDCLEVKGTTEKTLQHLKEFMYLGSLPDGTDLQALILIAKCYMMNRLEEQCAVKLACTVTAAELPDLVKFAMNNHLVGLFTAILQNTPDETINGINVLKKTKIEDK